MRNNPKWYEGYGAIHRHKIRARQSLFGKHHALYYRLILLGEFVDEFRPSVDAHLNDSCHQHRQSYDSRHNYPGRYFEIHSNVEELLAHLLQFRDHFANLGNSDRLFAARQP